MRGYVRRLDIGADMCYNRPMKPITLEVAYLEFDVITGSMKAVVALVYTPVDGEPVVIGVNHLELDDGWTERMGRICADLVRPQLEHMYREKGVDIVAITGGEEDPNWTSIREQLSGTDYGL